MHCRVQEKRDSSLTDNWELTEITVVVWLKQNTKSHSLFSLKDAVSQPQPQFLLIWCTSLIVLIFAFYNSLSFIMLEINMQNFSLFGAKDLLLSTVISYSFGVLFSIKSLQNKIPS